MIFALAGNQNCGKTTLFNQLTGSNQHVGNFPGVTVDQKIGEIRGQKDCSVVDLPGIYSIRPYTSEEIVTRDFILNEKPDGIINIVDATNIERNLYLTLQLIEMNIPMVLALNMMDEMRNNGGTVDISRMSEELGIPVVPRRLLLLISRWTCIILPSEMKGLRSCCKRRSMLQGTGNIRRFMIFAPLALCIVVSILFAIRLRIMRKRQVFLSALPQQS